MYYIGFLQCTNELIRKETSDNNAVMVFSNYWLIYWSCYILWCCLLLFITCSLLLVVCYLSLIFVIYYHPGNNNTAKILLRNFVISVFTWGCDIYFCTIPVVIEIKFTCSVIDILVVTFFTLSLKEMTWKLYSETHLLSEKKLFIWL